MNAEGPLRHIRIAAAAAAAIWTAVALVALVWTSALAHRSVVALAVAQARASFRKDLAYRRWALQAGGVYVPVGPAARPNPLLGAKDREARTATGRALTLLSPSTMTRQVLEADAEAGGPRGHLTSAQPLRPENRPDAWEAEALARLERGEPEVVEEIAHDAPTLRYMGRLVSDERCAACHESQRRSPAAVRGGISITVPMPEYFDAADAQTFRFAAAIGLVWAAGIGGILLAVCGGTRRVRERHTEREARAKLEEELAHARRLEAIGRVAGGIAHDLKNLLSPILGNSELALERVPPGAELRQPLEDIREAAERARLLAQRLLAFGRKQVLNVEPLDPTTVVEQLMPMVRQLVPHGVELRMDVGRTLPGIRADRTQLEAVLLNLVANARDAMPGGGVLRISTATVALDEHRATRSGIGAGRYVAIEVSDSGTGIDTAHVGRLFEPFFTTKPMGTGLGLASAHGTVRQLGGTIEVDTAPGRGSTFRVHLPALESEAVTPSRMRRDESAPGGAETVLLVEDEPAVRRYVEAALSSLGYRVLAAEDGEDALRISSRNLAAIDVLVSDLRMPAMGGRELYACLADRRPGLPTVFMSGYAGTAFGADDPVPPGTILLQKPFTRADLATAVRRVLDAQPRA